MRLNEKNIFLLDTIGATLSAGLAGLVLPHFAASLGLPSSILRAMALMGCVLAVYSAACFRFASRIKPFMLSAIIAANASYFVFSIIVFFVFSTLTIWGRMYLVTEFAVLFALILIEVRVYRRAFASTPG